MRAFSDLWKNSLEASPLLRCPCSSSWKELATVSVTRSHCHQNLLLAPFPLVVADCIPFLSAVISLYWLFQTHAILHLHLVKPFFQDKMTAVTVVLPTTLVECRPCHLLLMTHTVLPGRFTRNCIKTGAFRLDRMCLPPGDTHTV